MRHQRERRLQAIAEVQQRSIQDTSMNRQEGEQQRPTRPVPSRNGWICFEVGVRQTAVN